MHRLKLALMLGPLHPEVYYAFGVLPFAKLQTHIKLALAGTDLFIRAGFCATDAR
jgi:hypothetical protein